MEIYRSNGGRPTFHSKIFNFGGFAGLGLIGNYLLGGVVLHGNLQVKWRSTHIPQQIFNFGGFAGLGLIGNYLLGGVVLHGNLQVKWRSTHIPQQNFQFWWICGFGAYWELFARGGCFTWKFTGKMEVDPHSTAKCSILVDLRVWGLLGTIC